MHDALTEFDLVDIWTTFNPDGRRYTWRRKTPEIHCRLDFFLVSQSIATITQTVDIVPGYKTDHSIAMITLIISLHSSQRGNGFWKLNTSLLSDEDYVKSRENKGTERDTARPGFGICQVRKSYF